jgi:hypothetical protein
VLCRCQTHLETIVLDRDRVELSRRIRVLVAKTLQLAAILVHHVDDVFKLGVVVAGKVVKVLLKLCSVVAKAVVTVLNLNVVCHRELVLCSFLEHFLSELVQCLTELVAFLLSNVQTLFKLLEGIIVQCVEITPDLSLLTFLPCQHIDLIGKGFHLCVDVVRNH